MSKNYDVIVIGLGAMGSAAQYQLAARGKKVLGIDQFAPPHIFGSSHGDTRITRQAIGEGEAYVPLALRSHEIWKELESQSGKQLLFPVGGLIIGNPASANRNHGKEGFFQRTIIAAKTFSIPHQILETAELRVKFPQFKVRDGDQGYFEIGAGYLKPEECIRAHLDLAKRLGAEMSINDKVLDVTSINGGIEVKSNSGTYHAEQVVICAGPWVSDFAKSKSSYFKVYRQVLFWFTPKDTIDPFLPAHFPIFIWAFSDLDEDGVYGFPAIDGPNGGVKIAGEQYEITSLPDNVSREVSQSEIDTFYSKYIDGRMPMLSNQCVKAVSCLYTVTPDANFVIQRHPEEKQIIIVSPCSGHGFKHSAAIGEAIAQMVESDKTDIDLTSLVMKT